MATMHAGTSSIRVARWVLEASIFCWRAEAMGCRVSMGVCGVVEQVTARPIHRRPGEVRESVQGAAEQAFAAGFWYVCGLEQGAVAGEGALPIQGGHCCL